MSSSPVGLSHHSDAQESNAATPALKRVLLLSYYWPPSGGAGVQRWLKMSKYLVRMGWHLTVYTPENPDRPELDESLCAEVSSDIDLLTRKVVEPQFILTQLIGKRKKIGVGLLQSDYQPTPLQRAAIWIRANYFIPDARRFWIKPSAKYLTSWLSTHPVDAIISTGPPHSMHLIAEILHKRTGTPWLADFRDPWMDIDYMHRMPLTKRAKQKHLRLEKRVLESASAVTVVGEHMRAAYQKLTERPIYVVTNGYDADDFSGLRAIPQNARFILLHLGSVNIDRMPTLLWEAITTLEKEELISPKNFGVQMVGTMDARVRERLKEMGLSEYVEILPHMDHALVPQKLRSADALLLIINRTPTAKGILTGKLFEYLASGSPILAVGPNDGDAAAVIRECQAGSNIDYDDQAGFTQALRTLISRWKSGQLSTTTVGHEKFSREALAGQISDILDRLISNP